MKMLEYLAIEALKFIDNNFFLLMASPFMYHTSALAGYIVGAYEHNKFYQPIADEVFKIVLASWDLNSRVSGIYKINYKNIAKKIYMNGGKSFVYENPYKG